MEAIEPSQFDVVVLGTGLTESIVAAAAAKAGKSVLQLDPSAHYGGSWASMRLSELKVLLLPDEQPQQPEQAGNNDASSASHMQHHKHQPTAGISGAEVWQQPGTEPGPDNQFNIDLAPKVAYGAGTLIQLLLGSGAHNYLEFKLVQGSYLLQLDSSGSHTGLRSVPSSRSEVFKDRQLTPLQKRSVMRFLKAAAEALDGQGPLKDAFGQQPIQDLLEQQGLDLQLQQSVLHGVLLFDHIPCGDQGASMALTPQLLQLTAAEALERLRVYVHSVGRYGPDTGPFLTPLYGCGELPQAVCRVAAVAGAVQVLRCGIETLVFDEHTVSCSGVKLSNGQTICCTLLAAGEAAHQEWLAAFQPATSVEITHRCCAVLDGPLVSREQQTLVALLPPMGQVAGRSHQAVVRALALSSSTAVCPPGTHLLYLWTQASRNSSTVTGGIISSSSNVGSIGGSCQPQPAAHMLLPALAALADVTKLQPLTSSSSCSSKDSSTAADGTAAVERSVDVEALTAHAGSAGSSSEASKPSVLWAGFYSQTSKHLALGGSSTSADIGSRCPANVTLCPGPDSTATFASAVEAARKCYWRLFPPEDSDAAVFPLDPQAPQQQQQSVQAEQGATRAGAEPAEDVDSDDEVVAALQAAMQQMAGNGGDGPQQSVEQHADVNTKE